MRTTSNTRSTPQRPHSFASPSRFQHFHQTFGHEADPILAAFQAADLNKDGSLDENEFRLFLDAHLR